MSELRGKTIDVAILDEDALNESLLSPEAQEKINETDSPDEPIFLELVSDGTPEGTFLRDQDKREVPNVVDFSFGLDALGRQITTISFVAMPTEIKSFPVMVQPDPRKLRTLGDLVAESQAELLRRPDCADPENCCGKSPCEGTA